jgi:hypothetical protein
MLVLGQGQTEHDEIVILSGLRESIGSEAFHQLVDVQRSKSFRRGRAAGEFP